MLQNQTILIADDQAHVRLPLEYLVRTLPGVRVVTASNGRQAVELAVAQRPALVLLDVMMPELDGYAACRQIRQAWANHPGQIWFVTARGSTLDTDQAQEVGATRCITKPFDPDRILTLIREHLGLAGSMPGQPLRKSA